MGTEALQPLNGKLTIDLRQGDCLEVMKGIPDGSVDMVLCDLPYGVTEQKWDTVIPIDKLFEQYERIIKAQGSFLLFGQEPFSSRLRTQNTKLYKYDWYWVKNHGTGFTHAKNKPLYKVETISVFSKAPIQHYSIVGDRRMKYNPQGIEPDGKAIFSKVRHGRILSERPNQWGREYEKWKNFPDNVLTFKKVREKETLHPNQKPVALLEYLIKTYTNEGETVLDNCMGSGSTGVACVNTKRNFIGIELDPGYYEIAKKRIEEAERQE